MSTSLESVQWNACVHKLDLSVYSHSKAILGNEFRTHVNSKRKILSTGKFSSEEDWTQGAASNRAASPTHCQQTIPAPFIITLPYTALHSYHQVDAVHPNTTGHHAPQFNDPNAYPATDNNKNNNERISRAPFHVKHVQLCWTGANTKHLHIRHSKQVSKQSCWNIQLGRKIHTHTPTHKKTQTLYQRTHK